MIMTLEQNFGDVSISVTKCDSENDLKKRLASFGKSMVLQDDEDYAREYFLIKARCAGTDQITACGLLCGCSINPQIVVHPENFKRWILTDSMLFLVDMREAIILLSRSLPCVFYDVLSINDGVLIIAHELGVLAVNSNGEELWQIDGSDILVGWHIEEGRVVCRFDNGRVISHEV